MFIFKKIHLPVLAVLFFSFFLYIFFWKNTEGKYSNSVSPVPASATQIDNSENLINELENAKTYEERYKILEENKNIVNRELVKKILEHTDMAYKKEKLSTDKCLHLEEIANETAEFIGDRAYVVTSLFYKTLDEIVKKHNEDTSTFQKTAALYREKGDKEGEANFYYKLALSLYMDFSRNDTALNLLGKSINLSGEISDETMEAMCYALKGRVYNSLNDKNESVENYNKAIKIYDKHGDILNVIFHYFRMAMTCHRLGDLKESFGYLDKAKSLIEKIEPEKIKMLPEISNNIIKDVKNKEEWMIFYYREIAGLYYDMGNYEEAIKNSNKALEIANKVNVWVTDTRTSYWTLASSYRHIGQNDMVLKCYLEALKRCQDENDAFATAKICMDMGDFYIAMKQADEAIKYYELGSKNIEEITDKSDRNNIKEHYIIGLGLAYEIKGDFDKAIEKIEEAIKILEFNSGYMDVRHLHDSYLLISRICQKKGDNHKALLYLNKGLEYSGKTFGVTDIRTAISYECLGDFYNKTGELSNALDNYLQALKIIEETHVPDYIWRYHMSVGSIYEKQNNLKEAYNAYLNAIEIIENMRSELKIEEFKRDFMKSKIGVYEHMIELLIKMKREKDAFNYSERARARAFLDSLGNQKIDIHHGLDSDLMVKEKDLRMKIQILSGDIREEKTKPLLAQRSAFLEDTNNQLKQVKLEYEHILQEIKLKNPEYMTLVRVNPLSLEEIQKLLDKDTVIVEYFLGDKNSYVWITGYDSFNTVILNCNRKDMEELVKSYRDSACDKITLEKLNSNKWREISKKLYNMIFKDCEKYLLNKKRILISPHRVLHYLPFQVLTDSSGKMLVEKYDITYLPSASVLKYCQEKNTMKKNKLLAFELGDLKIGKLSGIPGTKEEIKSISRYMPEKEVYCGENMKTDVLYKKGGDFDIIHFATHGLLDSSSPLFSSIIFADRKLNVYEIFDLNLKAYLVCLSACRTGLGEESDGDELVGLSRAFIYAGTPTICSSLWDVSDVSTFELMGRFYFYLKDNNKSEALRLAQIDVMKKYSHPFFWAPFVLTGDWR